MGFTALRVVERLYHIAKPCLATFGGDLVFKAAVFYHGTCQHCTANMFRQGHRLTRQMAFITPTFASGDDAIRGNARPCFST